MSFGARAFVFIIYTLLGLSFLAGTAVLFSEFGYDRAMTFITFDSHLFLFFPTLGLVALAAFYLPSCALVDLYWRHIRIGPLRLLVGLITIAVAATFVAFDLSESRHRSIWDISPAGLATDASEPTGCGSKENPCTRVSLMEGVTNLSTVSRGRIGVRDFYRSCRPEPLIEHVAGTEPKRFCFASTPLAKDPVLSTDDQCCESQRLYQARIDTLHADPTQQSVTGRVHRLLLPGKVFFLFVLLAISIVLTLRHSAVMRLYPNHISRIEVGVIVGAIAMIFFPLMSQAFVQSADALFGVQQKGGFRSIVPLMSFLFGVWGLLVLLFFFRRRNQELELAAKLAGVVASTIAVVKYDQLVSIIVRYLGSGAGEVSIAVLLALALFAIVVLLSSFARKVVAGE